MAAAEAGEVVAKDAAQRATSAPRERIMAASTAKDVPGLAIARAAATRAPSCERSAHASRARNAGGRGHVHRTAREADRVLWFRRFFSARGVHTRRRNKHC